MELSVSSDAIDTISAIVTIIAPGYFAIQAYIFRYARAEKDFSRFLIECVVFGSLIVGIYNFMWTYLLHVTILETLRITSSRNRVLPPFCRCMPAASVRSGPNGLLHCWKTTSCSARRTPFPARRSIHNILTLCATGKVRLG